MKLIRPLLLVAITFAGSSALLHADVLTSYTFNNTQASSNGATNVDTSTAGDAGAISILPASTAAGITTGDTLSLLSGDDSYGGYSKQNGGNYYVGFGYQAYSTDNYATTLAEAVSYQQGYSFTIAPLAGTSLDLSTIDFSDLTLYGQGNSGQYFERDFYVESSLTASTVLGSFVANNPGGGAGGITSGDSPITLGSAFSDVMAPVTFTIYITGPQFPDQSAQDFDPNNYYFYGTGLTAGTLTINGTALSTPEPNAYALLALGLAGLTLALRHRRASRSW